MSSRWAKISVAICLWLGTFITPPTANADGGPLGPWHREGKTNGTFLRSQGLASDLNHGATTVYSWLLGIEQAEAHGHTIRQRFGIPLELLFAGYDHIGDIDSHAGVLILPYEGGAGEKAFGVWDFETLSFKHAARHTLEPGELPNNSWVAVSPDGNWMVNGEWHEMQRFVVFALDDLDQEHVSIAAEIRLDQPVTNVQGCDFVTATRLFCLSDDADADRPAFHVDLESELDGNDVNGAVDMLGPAPQEQLFPFLEFLCGSEGETEGVDVSGNTLRFVVIDPCLLWTHEYTYRR